MADDCIFCRIVRGELPGLKVYEDEKTLAFMDIAKDVDGHTLVIPKAHCKDLLECPPETLHAVADTVQKVSAHYVQDCGYDGVNLFNCTGACAGQTVFHFHMHIIPRKTGDGITGVPKFSGARDPLEETHARLRM